ncbi:MAG: TrbI/VirB10 family protein [Chlamydiota bacterium]
MSDSRERKKRQKRVFYSILGGIVLTFALFIVVISANGKGAKQLPVRRVAANPLPSLDGSFSEEKLRLSQVEITNDSLTRDLRRLEERMIEINENNALLNKKNAELEKKTTQLQSKLKESQKEAKAVKAQQKSQAKEPVLERPVSNALQVWGSSYTLHTENVEAVIPAGTVVKCMLVQGADFGVGVNKSSNPNTILLQPVKNGHLPKGVRVALKGARIIGSGYGDLASERAYIRAETMTLMVGRNGEFVETKIAGVVSGEDGKEGVRGPVVDRSGSIILRAGTAAFLGGITDSIEASLNNQAIAKLSKTSDSKSLLNVDTFRSAGAKGAKTSLGKMSDYYIKKAEQAQPVIQIQRGRIVDVIFVSSVRIGEKNIKGRIEENREERRRTEW